MDFSLVFATRGRIDLLEGLFRSLQQTTIEPNLIEVIAVIDDDDEITKSAQERLVSFLPNVSFRSRPRSNRLNEDYINWAARNSSGQFIFILNDDVIFKINGWDRLAISKLNNYLKDKPDGIVYGLTDDGMDSLRIQQKLQYTGFPIISRQAMNVLGYAMHPSFTSWGADIDLFSLYDSVGRICNLKSEVLAFHLSPHTNERESDDINKHVASISTERREKFDLNKDIEKLKLLIHKKIYPEPKQEKPANRQINTPAPKNDVVERYIKRITNLKNKDRHHK